MVNTKNIFMTEICSNESIKEWKLDTNVSIANSSILSLLRKELYNLDMNLDEIFDPKTITYSNIDYFNPEVHIKIFEFFTKELVNKLGNHLSVRENSILTILDYISNTKKVNDYLSNIDVDNSKHIDRNLYNRLDKALGEGFSGGRSLEYVINNLNKLSKLITYKRDGIIRYDSKSKTNNKENLGVMLSDKFRSMRKNLLLRNEKTNEHYNVLDIISDEVILSKVDEYKIIRINHDNLSNNLFILDLKEIYDKKIKIKNFIDIKLLLNIVDMGSNVGGDEISDFITTIKTIKKLLNNSNLPNYVPQGFNHMTGNNININIINSSNDILRISGSKIEISWNGFKSNEIPNFNNISDIYEIPTINFINFFERENKKSPMELLNESLNKMIFN